MVFERLSQKENAEEDIIDEIFPPISKLERDVDHPTDERPSGGDPDDVVEEGKQRSRTTCLYFMDPDDAQGMRDEMKQMGGDDSKATDVRVMTTCFGRAVRQASVLGPGLPTGQPLDDETGRLNKSTLRYKIVPSRRELFYASKCHGKERVGLFGQNPEDDAREVMMDAVTRMQMKKKREMMERTSMKRGEKETALRKEYQGRKGTTGVPVFYIDGMRGIVGKRDEVPLFFSYEDLIKKWKEMKTNDKKNTLPVKPSRVEVFNFFDVITALDKHQWQTTQTKTKRSQTTRWIQSMLRDRRLRPFPKAIPTKNDPNALDLEKIVFVSSQRSIDYKKQTEAKGNSKARLRPMR